LIKLVVVGEAIMEVPKNDAIIATGFIDESLKTSLLLKAKALVMPSFYESLSLVTLESMANGIPVIANKDCEVLKDHIENSQAGFLFNDYKSFEKALKTIDSLQFDVNVLSANAKKYIAQNYTWDVTIEKYQKAIARLSPR
jgi:glycosyltransferase involved in cell wall biosynthesis